MTIARDQEHYGVGVFRDLAIHQEYDLFITTDRYMEFANSHLSHFRYLKRDFLFRSGNFRDINYLSILSGRKEYEDKILIIGHSDIETNRIQAHILKHLGIKGVYSTNAKPSKNFLHPIPLGLTNNCDDSKLHRIFGNHSLLLSASKVSEFPTEFAPHLYVNFTSHNNRSARGALLKQLESLPKNFIVKHSSPDFSASGRINYLAECRKTNFVVCPEGNGVDTHRLWETLYMGGVPIVKKNAMLTPIIEGLPVVQVDKWSQINSAKFLENEWHRVQNLIWDKSRLSINYWRANFLNSI